MLPPPPTTNSLPKTADVLSALEEREDGSSEERGGRWRAGSRGCERERECTS
jgi:hypothetical protein